ncbi:STAS/SEC14 domain-containing protein [candidate division WOR-3 bacterium]|nr:STAS/SEC14 domain-containing protein [candidate division WOR-3 bacterium]
MPYKLHYDEYGIAYLKIIENLTSEDVEKVMGFMNSEHGGKSSSFLLCDLQESPKIVPDKAVRQALRELKGTFRWQKVAIIGADRIARMAAKLALTALGKRQLARFFETKAKALRWLKGEEK